MENLLFLGVPILKHITVCIFLTVVQVLKSNALYILKLIKMGRFPLAKWLKGQWGLKACHILGSECKRQSPSLSLPFPGFPVTGWLNSDSKSYLVQRSNRNSCQIINHYFQKRGRECLLQQGRLLGLIQYVSERNSAWQKLENL